MATNRLFISYRSADGKKDAHRLAEDLGRLFGQDEVFLDKHDLQAGQSWRDALLQALAAKPVVLVVLTPQYLGAMDGDARRIDRADDPVRQELGAARAGGATVLPLLAEGATMPRADSLPESLRFLPELHALPLRSEDWRADIARVVAHLAPFGLKPRDADWPESYGLAAPVRVGRWIAVTLAVPLALMLLLGGVADDTQSQDNHIGAAFLAFLLVLLAWWARQRLGKAGHWGRHLASLMLGLAGLQTLGHLSAAASLSDGSGLVAAQAASGAASAPLADLAGVWQWTMDGVGPMGPLTLKQDGSDLHIVSPRINTAEGDQQKVLNALAKARGGLVVESARMKGVAVVSGNEVNGLLNMVAGAEDIAFGTGTLKLTLQPDGRTLRGSLDLMNHQGPQGVTLTRQP